MLRLNDAMVVNTNISSQSGARTLGENQAMLSKSLARLSSGSKLINPSDDAAGMAVSTRLDSQVNRLNAAKSNINNAISFTQTQDNHLRLIGKALDRMSELSVLAQDITKSDADRSLYNSEFVELSDYISKAATKEFNGVALFSSTNLDVTVDSDGGVFTMSGIDLSTSAYTDATGSTIDTLTNAKDALTKVKATINQLSADRASIGSSQSRLNLTLDQLSIVAENLTSASSRIKDVDVAEESANYAKQNILVQTGTAMLVQANQMPQTVLKLLQ